MVFYFLFKPRRKIEVIVSGRTFSGSNLLGFAVVHQRLFGYNPRKKQALINPSVLGRHYNKGGNNDDQAGR